MTSYSLQIRRLSCCIRWLLPQILPKFFLSTTFQEQDGSHGATPASRQSLYRLLARTLLTQRLEKGLFPSKPVLPRAPPAGSYVRSSCGQDPQKSPRDPFPSFFPRFYLSNPQPSMSDNQSVTSSMEESMVPPHGAMKGDELVDQLKKDFKDCAFTIFLSLLATC